VSFEVMSFLIKPEGVGRAPRHWIVRSWHLASLALTQSVAPFGQKVAVLTLDIQVLEYQYLRIKILQLNNINASLFNAFSHTIKNSFFCSQFSDNFQPQKCWNAFQELTLVGQYGGR
jgi:hypothetical protein